MNLNDILDFNLKTASKYNGKIFEGYAWNIIIPEISCPKFGFNFKDVDIWFVKESDVECYINEMKNLYDFRIVNNFTVDNNNPHYSFNRTQYHLYINKCVVCLFDIVISECFPVDDFDINNLVYYYKNNELILECPNEKFDVNQLIININKRLNILDTYKDKMNKKGNVAIFRINNRFIKYGWEINYGKIKLRRDKFIDSYFLIKYLCKYDRYINICLKYMMIKDLFYNNVSKYIQKLYCINTDFEDFFDCKSKELTLIDYIV